MKRYKEAIAAHQEAARGASERAIAFYNLSCEYALTGEKEKAIDAAAKAIEAGYRVRSSYENNTDLAVIRDDARFKALLSKL